MGTGVTLGWDLGDEVRLRAISEADLFPGVPEPTFEPYARIVARLLDVPVALVSIVDDERQFFPAQVGVGEPWASRGETPLSMSFCQHVVRGDAPLIVVDATDDERVAGNLAIEELDVIAYLGVPLRAPGGAPLGSLCAIANHPREWTDDELVVLEEVADAIAQLIAVRTSEHRWSRYAAEASHRLRTPVSVVRFELEDLLAWPSMTDDARAALRSAADRAQELSDIVDELARLAQRQETVGRRSVQVTGMLEAALDAAGVDGWVEGDPAAVVSSSPTLLRAVVGDLISLLVGTGAGAVRASVELTDEQVAIDLVGDGPGDVPVVPPEIRERVIGHLRGRIGAAASAEAGYRLVLPL